MANSRSRRWADRDGTEWEILYDPGVELDTPRDRAFRKRIVFRAGEKRFHAPAAYGSDLDTLSDADLQGMLDAAREEQEGESSAWAEGSE